MSATNTSDYLPSESEQRNGANGHNGHKKVFELAPVKGPEEAELEYIREFAPKLRRKIREDEALSGGAKFFYMALLDDSFMWKFGGNGRGQLWVTVQDLAERYKHDRKTIEAWREELCARRWVYYRRDWPFPEWRITNLCPAPETRNETAAAQMSLGRAASEEAAARDGKVSRTPENGHFPSQVPDNGNGDGKDRKCNWEKTEVQSPIFPSATSDPSPVSVGESPSCTSDLSQSRCHTSGSAISDLSQSDKESLPSEPPSRPTPARAKPALENTPGAVGIGAVGKQSLKRLGNRVKDEAAKRSNRRQRGDAEEFLAKVAEVCGQREVDDNKGLWWTNLHADPNLAWEVIHDTANAKQEGRIKKTAARHAMDYWKRRWAEKHPA